MFLTFTNESKTGFENRKWNYFSYFLTSNQKTSFKKVFSFYQGVKYWFWKQEIELSKQEMELFLLLLDFNSNSTPDQTWTWHNTSPPACFLLFLIFILPRKIKKHKKWKFIVGSSYSVQNDACTDSIFQLQRRNVIFHL